MKKEYLLFILALSLGLSCSYSKKTELATQERDIVNIQNIQIDITDIMGTWFALEDIDGDSVIYNYPSFIDSTSSPLVYKLKKDSISVIYSDYKSGYLAIDSIWIDKGEYFIRTKDSNGFSFRMLDQRKRIGVWSQLFKDHISKSFERNCIDSAYNTFPVKDYPWKNDDGI